MGMIGQVMGAVLGSGRNAVVETVEAFRENAEAAGLREHDLRRGAMAQFAGEFAEPQPSWFDRLIDGLNRLPRPAMALGTLGLMVAAMADPIWFASRMQGIALVPEPLWWLMGAIVSFYFGARHQVKGQEFRRNLAASVVQAGEVTASIRAIEALRAGSGAIGGEAAEDGTGEEGRALLAAPDGNAALDAWRAARAGA